jgi:iron(III) transport system substrate-binding protein
MGFHATSDIPNLLAQGDAVKRTRRDAIRLLGGVTLAAASGDVLSACGRSSAPKAVQPSTVTDIDQLYAAAKKEGKLVWWCAQFDIDVTNAVQKAFMAKYPGIDVEFIRQGSGVIFKKAAEDFKAGAYTVDVVGTSDMSNFAQLKGMSALAEFRPPEVTALPAALQNIDPDQTYQASQMGFIIIDYQKDKVAQPPTDWKALLDPAWSGKISLGHPGYSGYVMNWAITIFDKYGEGYFKDLAAQKPLIGQSIQDTITRIVASERLVGHGDESAALRMQAAGNPIAVSWPTDFVPLAVAPQAVMKNAPHPNAARLFQSFNFSPEFSGVLRDNWKIPIRSDVTSKSGKKLSDVASLQVSVADLSSKQQEIKDLWRKYMGV